MQESSKLLSTHALPSRSIPSHLRIPILRTLCAHATQQACGSDHAAIIHALTTTACLRGSAHTVIDKCGMILAILSRPVQAAQNRMTQAESEFLDAALAYARTHNDVHVRIQCPYASLTQRSSADHVRKAVYTCLSDTTPVHLEHIHVEEDDETKDWSVRIVCDDDDVSSMVREVLCVSHQTEPKPSRIQRIITDSVRSAGAILRQNEYIDMADASDSPAVYRSLVGFICVCCLAGTSVDVGGKMENGNIQELPAACGVSMVTLVGRPLRSEEVRILEAILSSTEVCARIA